MRSDEALTQTALSLVGHAELVEAVAHRCWRDLEEVSKIVHSLDAVSPVALDEALGHKHAGCELISGAFNKGVRLRGLVSKESAVASVADHVVVLVQEAEPLRR